ncbi:hypothetical protein HKBW3S03_01169, partial [Candidatus Hakubella thermalkaliphila]
MSQTVVSRQSSVGSQVSERKTI